MGPTLLRCSRALSTVQGRRSLISVDGPNFTAHPLERNYWKYIRFRRRPRAQSYRDIMLNLRPRPPPFAVRGRGPMKIYKFGNSGTSNPFPATGRSIRTNAAID